MTELKLAPHSQKSGTVIEVWHNGQFVGQVTAGTGPGASLRVLSKHRVEAKLPGERVSISIADHAVNEIEVRIA